MNAAVTEGMFGRMVARIARLFSIYDVDEPAAGIFRARQLQSVLRLAPLTLVANALNACVIVAIFWSAGTMALLPLWGIATSFVVWRGVRASRRKIQQGGLPHTASLRAIHRATQHALLLASLWALLPVVLFPRFDAAHQLFLTAVMTGMMCAGGFALMTLPLAATGFVVILGASTAAALIVADSELAWPIAGLLIVYVCIVVASIWSAARMFGARLTAESEAERQSHVVGLLLRDYEENASDALWEVDGAGRLCRASQKFSTLFGSPDAYANGASIMDILRSVAVPDFADNAQALQTISNHFDKGTPFRDVIVAIRHGEAVRWWAITAKPLVDAGGLAYGWRGVASNVTATEEAKSRLTWLAHHDPLTGLANRHQFRSYLATLLAGKADRSGGRDKPSAVICIDLDDFKVINDTLGHATGDELLCEVSRRLLTLVREHDMVARLGGDEFAIVLREVGSAAEADVITRRLLAGLEAPCDLKGARVQARASIGVALAPQDGNEIDTLLNHADLALYAAKAAGKGQFRAFATQMVERTRRRLRIEEGLRHALDRGEMWLVFQPQVNLKEWKVTGFEALLRWYSPELGEVSPVEFIPVAEESGMIQSIGQWVLEQACREAAAWPRDTLVSVNVSPVQAMSQDMHAIACKALSDSGLAASRLEIEITESVFMTDSQAAIDVLVSLRKAGVRIALDDFGTGFSSLSYLQRFPFDTLKIDRSFVKEIAAQREQRAIVKMIIALANVLGMRTVAEGVEDGSQLGVLNRYSCETIQGYLVAKPMEARQVSAFLAAWGLLPMTTKGIDPVATDLVPMAEAAA